MVLFNKLVILSGFNCVNWVSSHCQSFVLGISTNHFPCKHFKSCLKNFCSWCSNWYLWIAISWCLYWFITIQSAFWTSDMGQAQKLTEHTSVQGLCCSRFTGLKTRGQGEQREKLPDCSLEETKSTWLRRSVEETWARDLTAENMVIKEKFLLWSRVACVEEKDVLQLCMWGCREMLSQSSCLGLSIRNIKKGEAETRWRNVSNADWEDFDSDWGRKPNLRPKAIETERKEMR